ncbi:MAG: hypothetical protein ACKVTZ_10205 [Bacteroidia bacterium]
MEKTKLSDWTQLKIERAFGLKEVFDIYCILQDLKARIYAMIAEKDAEEFA